MQIFANGDQRFPFFIELYVIRLKKSRGKNLDHGTTSTSVIFGEMIHTW